MTESGGLRPEDLVALRQIHEQLQDIQDGVAAWRETFEAITALATSATAYLDEAQIEEAQAKIDEIKRLAARTDLQAKSVSLVQQRDQLLNAMACVRTLVGWAHLNHAKGNTVETGNLLERIEAELDRHLTASPEASAPST